MDIILAPIISEKSMNDAKVGRFTFKVAKQADKNQIKTAVERKFKVSVLDISTSIVKPKKKISVQRHKVVISAWKKATVKLVKGEKIAMFDIAGAK